MPAGPAAPQYLVLAVVFGIVAGFVLGAVLSLQVGTRLLAHLRGIWGRRASRVRFELLEQ